MRQKVKFARVLGGQVRPPGDKSISHRAIILNSIASGDATVRNFAYSADCLATVDCLRALGVEIETDENDGVRVHGVGRDGFKEAEDVLSAQNSGTTIRMLSGLLSGQPFFSIITGDTSLRSRPMDRVIRPLTLMGAWIRGRCNDSRAPLVIRGGEINGIRYTLPIASAQLKSAIMLAALFARGHTMLIEPAHSRDHTERLLKAMGAVIETRDDNIRLSPGELRPKDLTVPGDISAAAFWLVAGAIHPQANITLLNTGINPTRSGILDVLLSMGAKLDISNERLVSGEPIADIEVHSSKLTGVEIKGEIIPRLIDEIPVIALAASLARGRTVIRDAKELRFKETDRIRVTVEELSKMGVNIKEIPDGMVIDGREKLHAAVTNSKHDHRIAKMLGVAGLVAPGETEIDNAEVVDISYSSFWRDLERLRLST